jgi:Zn finger protein HypA/HybF involved in hydrogenase expression
MTWIIDLLKGKNGNDIIADIELKASEMKSVDEYARTAKAQIKSDMTDIAARLRSLPDQERHALAFRLYYEYEHINATPILEAAGLTRQDLTGTLKVHCRECKNLWEHPIRSRTEYQQTRQFEQEMGHAGACPECERTRKDRRAAKIDQENSERVSLKRMDYREFLLTRFWGDVRSRKLKQARFRCQVCNSNGRLNVHHRSYENHGYEDLHLEDLIVLCEGCHGQFHREGKLAK